MPYYNKVDNQPPGHTICYSGGDPDPGSQRILGPSGVGVRLPQMLTRPGHTFSTIRAVRGPAIFDNTWGFALNLAIRDYLDIMGFLPAFSESRSLDFRFFRGLSVRMSIHFGRMGNLVSADHGKRTLFLAQVVPIWEFPKIRGTIFRVPYNRDPTIW